MFLHLGGNVLIEAKNVIAIIDIEKNKSEITKEFIDVAKEEGFIKRVTKDQPKTLIITEIDNRSNIFLTSISSTTIHKRIKFIDQISNVNLK